MEKVCKGEEARRVAIDQYEGRSWQEIDTIDG